GAQAGTALALQALLIRGALHLDQVRHLRRFRDAAERVAEALLAGERGGGEELTVDGEFRFGLGHSVFPMRRTGQSALNAAATARLPASAAIGFDVHPRASRRQDV